MLFLARSRRDDPARVSTQSPTGDGPDQRLFVLKRTDEPGDELAEMRCEVINTTWYQQSSQYWAHLQQRHLEPGWHSPSSPIHPR
jgi:hypothetical protein